MEETPRSKRTPCTRAMPSRSSTSGSSSYTACTRVARSPYGARRSPDSRRASLSRSRATRRASGNRVSRASLCPPRPSVQSTTTAPGSWRAGANRSRHRWSITGTCRWLKGPSQIRRGPYAPPGPRPLEEGEAHAAPEASADREREEAEPYVRAAHAGRSPAAAPGSLGEFSAVGRSPPPASRHFSPPCLAVNQPACASWSGARVKRRLRENHSYGPAPATRVGYLTRDRDDALYPLSQRDRRACDQ